MFANRLNRALFCSWWKSLALCQRNKICIFMAFYLLREPQIVAQELSIAGEVSHTSGEVGSCEEGQCRLAELI